MANKILLRHGDLPRQPCQVCFKTRSRFGTMVDPNGHVWLICNRCINYLWRHRQAMRDKAITDV